jgi:CRP/FNR family transcriptional regulator
MFDEILEPPKTAAWAGEEPAYEPGDNSAAFSGRLLGPDEILFETGDIKTCLYRVESGAVALHEQRWNGYHAVIDFAFPGDLVGLGFLDSHACCARALAETKLTRLPLESQSRAIKDNAKAQQKLHEAIEREFEFRRALFVGSCQQSPLKRVAAFLVSLSRMNAREGRDPWMVADACPSGFVAELLGLDVRSLAAHLAELERRGLIEPCPHSGLRLKDVNALEEVARADSVPVPLDRREAQVLDRERAAAPRKGKEHARAS